MKPDYIIPKGTKLKMFPSSNIDPKLKYAVEEALRPFPCVDSFAICHIKQGWFFPKKTKMIYVLYTGEKEYAEANKALAKRMNDFFSGLNDFADCVSLDLKNPVQREFADEIKKGLPFAKN